MALAYQPSPVGSQLASVTQSGHRLVEAGQYVTQSMPPVQFGYTEAAIAPVPGELDAVSLANLPMGVDADAFRFTDLDSEGVPGILTSRRGGWRYKASRGAGQYEAGQELTTVPATAAGAPVTLMDLAGAGRLDLVDFSGDTPRFHRRATGGWEPASPFRALPPVDWHDPNLRFVDLDGDGLADILLTRDDHLIWYPSQGESGFGPARSVPLSHDEDDGPRLIFADGTESVYLADMSGDGLSDLVRIRVSDISYWPSLGFGRFGPRRAMDNAPRLDRPDQLDGRRIRLADIDGSGTADLIYLGADGTAVYRNQSGNSWSDAQFLPQFPRIDDLTSVTTADVLGNGTACLVWSTAAPASARRPIRYLSLTGAAKPFLLTSVSDGLGAETLIEFSTSTAFYLQDKQAGRPWVTRLPFPVHVVARVETRDLVGRTRYVTRYAYHHGYYDGTEREFRGFALVEQWDTEEHRGDLEFGDEPDSAGWQPPVRTRTWFSTGAPGDATVSRDLAGEYWVPPDLSGDAQQATRAALDLPDSVIPDGLTIEERRQAFRALRGTPLRVEITSQDGTDRAANPYRVTEQRAEVTLEQTQGANRYAIFTAHPAETLHADYERTADDPRLTHDLILETDDYGDVLRSVTIGYGRATSTPPEPDLSAAVQAALHYDQHRVHARGTLQQFTSPLTDPATWPDDHRTPAIAASTTAELTGPPFIQDLTAAPRLYRAAEVGNAWQQAWTPAGQTPFEQLLAADVDGGGEAPAAVSARITTQTLTRYRSDELATLLDTGVLEPMALPGESYRLAFTGGLLTGPLGGLATPDILSEGGYVQLPGHDGWWLPSGRVYLSAGDDDSAAAELAQARAHFFQPRRYVDAYGGISRVTPDPYDLLRAAIIDPAGNVTLAVNDYRALRAVQTTDPNGATTAVALDCLNIVAGTAVSGQNGEGDSLAGSSADLTDAEVAAFFADPLTEAPALLASATTRMVIDRTAFSRTSGEASPAPPAVYTISRETHAAELPAGRQSSIQHAVAYYDGLGRGAQHKVRAQDGPLTPGGALASPRWIASGWTIYNNKGQRDRAFDPFFTSTHQFEFSPASKLSVVFLYDAPQRVIATARADGTFTKTVFDAWRQLSYDASDTVLITDPRTDPDVGAAFRQWLGGEPSAWRSWYAPRAAGTLGTDADERAANQDAAAKAAAHAETPATAYLDSLGRACLQVADNTTAGGVSARLPTRTALDTDGRTLAVIDPLGRRVAEYCARDTSGASLRYLSGYDLLGRNVYHTSADGGERRTLPDVSGHPVRGWDARGQTFRFGYDALRRLTHRWVQDTVSERLLELSIYGEDHPDPTLNLKGRLFRRYDGAGAATSQAYDFKANLISAAQQLPVRPAPSAGTWASPDWSAVDAAAGGAVLDVAALDHAAAPLLIPGDLFTSSSSFDAMNRPTQQVLPCRAAAPPSVIQPTYDRGGLLDALGVWIRLAGPPDALLDPATASLAAITGIDYDEHGQRTSITRGNGTVTTQSFDPDTHRLTAITTTRPGPASGATVQDLRLTYDPTGHLTRIRDDADIQNVVFFRNQRVDPTADYTYDPLYRLIRATGREHLGQTGAALSPPAQVTNNDAPRTQSPLGTPILNPGDGNAMGTYIETYGYDALGNIATMAHRAAGAGWTRSYSYAEPSQIIAAETANRLSATSLPGDPAGGPYSARYSYDSHGNLTTMPHLSLMVWDELDHLAATSTQVVNSGTPESTYYNYDTVGSRARKATFRQAAKDAAPVLKSERVYLGAIELYRAYDGNGTVTLERETLHAQLDGRNVVITESRAADTLSTDPAPALLQRYQYGNHLGSALLELDDQAAVVSYEEYFPYGSTAYQAVRSALQTPKRYRYTTRERDEENDLGYHEARYYAPWLGRWTAIDPTGLKDGLSGYAYCRGDPVGVHDPVGLEYTIVEVTCSFS